MKDERGTVSEKTLNEWQKEVLQQIKAGKLTSPVWEVTHKVGLFLKTPDLGSTQLLRFAQSFPDIMAEKKKTEEDGSITQSFSLNLHHATQTLLEGGRPTLDGVELIKVTQNGQKLTVKNKVAGTDAGEATNGDAYGQIEGHVGYTVSHNCTDEELAAVADQIAEAWKAQREMASYPQARNEAHRAQNRIFPFLKSCRDQLAKEGQAGHKEIQLELKVLAEKTPLYQIILSAESVFALTGRYYVLCKEANFAHLPHLMLKMDLQKNDEGQFIAIETDEGLPVGFASNYSQLNLEDNRERNNLSLAYSASSRAENDKPSEAASSEEMAVAPKPADVVDTALEVADVSAELNAAADVVAPDLNLSNLGTALESATSVDPLALGGTALDLVSNAPPELLGAAAGVGIATVGVGALATVGAVVITAAVVDASLKPETTDRTSGSVPAFHLPSLGLGSVASVEETARSAMHQLAIVEEGLLGNLTLPAGAPIPRPSAELGAPGRAAAQRASKPQDNPTLAKEGASRPKEIETSKTSDVSMI